MEGIEKGQILICSACKKTRDFPMEIFLKQEQYRVYSLYDTGWTVYGMEYKIFCDECSKETEELKLKPINTFHKNVRGDYCKIDSTTTTVIKENEESKWQKLKKHFQSFLSALKKRR